MKAFSISNDELNFIGVFFDLAQKFDLNSYNRDRNSTTGIILSFTWPCFAGRVEILSTIYHQKLTEVSSISLNYNSTYNKLACFPHLYLSDFYSTKWQIFWRYFCGTSAMGILNLRNIDNFLRVCFKLKTKTIFFCKCCFS